MHVSIQTRTAHIFKEIICLIENPGIYGILPTPKRKKILLINLFLHSNSKPKVIRKSFYFLRAILFWIKPCFDHKFNYKCIPTSLEHNIT